MKTQKLPDGARPLEPAYDSEAIWQSVRHDKRRPCLLNGLHMGRCDHSECGKAHYRTLLKGEETESWRDPNGPDTGDTKPSNPKDVIGARKLDLGNVPDSLIVGAAVALLEGALKYGRFNWRLAGVRASIYHAACRRHLAKWWNGQDYDLATRVHHVDSAIACLAILRDAMVYEMLTDDRPPCPNPDLMADMVDIAEETGAHLRELHKDKSPRQWSIVDTPREPK